MPAFTYHTRIYFKDTDASGVVYHANYLVLAEQARTAWQLVVDDNYTNKKMMARGEVFVVRRANLEYFSPALLDDEIDIVCWVKEIKGASGIFYQEFRRDDKVLATLNIQVVMVKIDTGRPIRLDEQLKEKYKAYVLEEQK